MKINPRFWNFLLTCFLLSFLIGCASTGSPSGGPRDKTPPGLVEEKSSTNFSTNFSPKKIELVFDEWIELKNQQREILISPPFFKNPKITSRGKKITVEFPEEEPLRENATYTLNFGKSIVDFTEGNTVEGFRFIFSTGDKIDSLSLSGSIAEAKNSKPVKDILVLLYDVVEDSVVMSEKPFYYARTDDSGSFKFENLKNDTFKLLVLEDLNFNYLLDPELERLAFPDSLLVLNDSSNYNPKLRLFKPEQSLRILNSSSQTPGLISTVFNKDAKSVNYNFIYPSDFMPLVEKSKDTLMFWFAEPQDSVGVIYGSDTLDFTIKAFDSLFYEQRLSMVNSNVSKTILAPFDSLQMSFSSPLVSVDTSLIRLTSQPVIKAPILSKDSLNMTVDTFLTLNDSLNNFDSLLVGIDTLEQKIDTLSILENLDATDSIAVDSTLTIIDSLTTFSDSLLLDSLKTDLDTILTVYKYSQSLMHRNLYVNSNWEEKSDYRLELLPGAITDIYGRQNDTLFLDFKIAGLDEFGNITINLSGLDSAQHYVVLLKLNDEVIKKYLVRDSIINKIEHKNLSINTYSIELIKDDDSNGEWTTGNYWLKRQPEELKIFELEKLRENWDLEAEVFWNDVKTVPIDSSGISQDSSLVNPAGSKIPKRGKNTKPDSIPKQKRLITNKKEKGKND